MKPAHGRTTTSGLLGITETGNIIQEMINFPVRSLHQVNKALLIEYLRKINNDLIYVVFKVESENKSPYFMYLFFEKLAPATESVKDTLFS
jgi:hypothetical protein